MIEHFPEGAGKMLPFNRIAQAAGNAKVVVFSGISKSLLSERYNPGDQYSYFYKFEDSIETVFGLLGFTKKNI